MSNKNTSRNLFDQLCLTRKKRYKEASDSAKILRKWQEDQPTIDGKIMEICQELQINLFSFELNKEEDDE